MKINQIIINELSEGARPGVATPTAQTPQAQAAAQAIQKGLEKLQQQSPGLDHSFNTTTAIQEILPDGTVVMDSNLQPSALQNVRKILALGGGANFKVSMSHQGIPSAANMSTVPPAQPQPGVAEGDVPFRGVGGAFNRGDNERHDLDPTDWYIVKDGEMFSASIYPRQTQQAIAQGFSRTRAEAKARVDSQDMTEDSLGLKKLHDALWTVISEQTIDQENINEIDPGMISNLYSVFPTVTKIIVSNALDKARKEAKETSIMIDVMKKHANNQPVTPEENEAMKSQFKDIVSYGLSAVAGVLTATVAGPAAGVGVALAGAYKKELLTLLQTKGPEVLIGLLKSKGKLDVVDILSAKLLGKHALPFYAPAKLTTGSVNQGVAEAGNANSGRRGPNFQDNSPAIPGRVEPLPQGLKHHADASRYGGTEPNVEDDRLLGPAQRHRLHQAVTPDDWFDESQEKIAGRHDPDDFDNMVGRLKQLAGAGPLKTVWDPARRVYRNVPHAVQPPQQPKKATQ